MESFPFYDMPTSPQPFDDDIAFPSHTSFDLLSKLNLEPIEFLDSLEDALTKETNTPKELTRFEENTVTSIGLLEKKIQKLPRKNKKNAQEDGPITLAKNRDKRNIKKPCHEYENTRLQEEERKKSRKLTKKIQKMKETLTKPGDIPTEAEGPFRKNKPEESYQWRDWSLYFNQEIVTLGQEGFFAFMKIVHDKHPECVSFEKGYGELKMILPDSMRQDAPKKMTPLVEQNLVYQLFCGYIEEVKKTKNGN